MSESPSQTVLILGAGVNGVAVARELVLNGVPVVIVDTHDIAFGASAKSSRLIHGGVRYLEYGDFELVRESLAERTRLLRLAPQFVKPLRLYIPVRTQFGGFLQAGIRFMKLHRFDWFRRLSSKVLNRSDRGLWTVRSGLWLYDRFAKKSQLPGRDTHRIDDAGVPKLNRSRYRRLCSYSDGQMLPVERFVLAMLTDTEQVAKENNVRFEVHTYHRAIRDGSQVRIVSTRDDSQVATTLTPATIVNATGAWGDRTLDQIEVESQQLLAGTKGSHIITRHRQLREALGDGGVYAEAPDGRLVFLLPWGERTMVGTTDERFEGSPGEVVASEEEIAYLLRMANSVMADIVVTRKDVESHYCGVRPLPYVASGKTGSIPRGHWIETNTAGPVPIDTLIGGKLTTCRAFGEEVADRILARLDVERSQSTRDRLLPGGEGDFSPQKLADRVQSLATETGCTTEQARAVFSLVGSRAASMFRGLTDEQHTSITGTDLPIGFVEAIIESEWVSTLGDLIERRLNLIWVVHITENIVHELADALIRTGRLTAANRDQSVEDAATRLREFYGVDIDLEPVDEIPIEMPESS